MRISPAQTAKKTENHAFQRKSSQYCKRATHLLRPCYLGNATPRAASFEATTSRRRSALVAVA